MTPEQTKLIERLAEAHHECERYNEPSHIESFIAGATHPKIAEMYRGEGAIKALLGEAAEFKAKGWLGCASGATNLADFYQTELNKIFGAENAD